MPNRPTRSSMERQIHRLLKHHQDWVVETGNEVRDRALAKIKPSLEIGGRSEARGLASPLGSIAVFHGNWGIVHLSQKRFDEGWTAIERACVYHHWALRLEERAVSPIGPLTKRWPDWTRHTGVSACLLSKALVFGDQQLMGDAIRWFSSVASGKFDIAPKFWQRQQFQPGILRLANTLGVDTGASLIESRDCGPYDTALSCAGDASEFARALSALCVFHLAHIETSRSDDIAPL